MDQLPPLQQILGTDKKNPVFTIYRDAKEQILHVYYGGKLLEKVPDDKRHPEFKLLLARLSNSGVKATVLERVFGVDHKTMKRWGSALTSGDPELLMRVLAGRGANRKLSLEIRSYIEMRFPIIYQETRYEYSKRMREEIERVFGKKVSGETIRPLLKVVKEKEVGKADPIEPELEAKNGENHCDCLEPKDAKETEIEEVLSDNRPIRFSETNDVVVGNRKGLPDFCEEQGIRFCHHLGILIFSSMFLRLEAVLGEGSWVIKQWVAAILLGAVNIEQSKLLDIDDLRFLLGQILRFPHRQRLELERLAMTETVERLVQFNVKEVNASSVSDFYYDPHTKRYTGMQKVLKGWCPGIRLADKALHMDFIHTSEGCPVYIEHTDNYEDLRQRFMKTVNQFRDVLGIEKKRTLTFTIDRGIYGYDFFQGIILSEFYHVITWEKGYELGTWKNDEVKGTFILERSRNRADDVQKYTFEYMDQSWGKNAYMRQLKVRATNPEGRTIEVSVLTDDKDRNGEEVISLIFRRWIQENDFKYLDKHFGINEITSYATTPYKRLKDNLEERQMKSGAYKALEEQRRQIRKDLGRLLFQEHQNPGKSPERTKKIHTLDQCLQDIDAKMKTTEKEMSRLRFLIDQQYVRLDTRNKTLMDMLKLIARNAFYKKLEPFKRMYDNYRDDHVLFRNLTHAHGLILQQSDSVEAVLYPTAHYPPKLRRIVEVLLDQINETRPSMPDGSGRSLRFRLGEKSGIKLAIVLGQNRPF
ncbi:MAG: hypothetical protein H8D67_07105 [Deltaproteobacteria bacterium]|nr:hypothetical protein [Deltaproteobacteria bacterium]